jgi:hypothetical protein
MLLVALVLVAAPYADPSGRFTLSLPEGWRPTVLDGAPGASAFRREREGKVINVVVEVTTLGPDTSLATVVRESGRAASKAPGYKLTYEGQGKLGLLPCHRRRYVSAFGEGGRWLKLSEDRWAVAGARAFVVHAESTSDAFPSFERDLEALFAGFRPGSPEAGGGGLVESPVVGRWVMVDSPDTALDLRADGTFELAGQGGTFRVDGASLEMQAFGAEAEVFMWRLVGADLVLEAPSLGGAITYRKAGGATTPK